MNLKLASEASPDSLPMNPVVRAALAICIAIGASHAEVFSDVPEATTDGYKLVYDLEIPEQANYYGAVAPSYAVNTANSAGAFDRVAYYLELTPISGPRRWIYVSMDAFTQNAVELGVPAFPNSSHHFQQEVRHLNIASNVAGISTGQDIPLGNIEVWSRAVGPKNAGYFPGASDNAADAGDLASVDGFYGSFNLNRLSGGPNVLFGWSGFVSNDVDSIGIGNQGLGNPDWYLAKNASEFERRRLQVLVRSSPLRVTLSEFPERWAFVPRRLSDNKGTVRIEGIESSGGWEMAVLNVFRDDHFQRSSTVSLAYEFGKATFSFFEEILAERAGYSFELGFQNASGWRFCRRSDKVVAGDAFILQGQSNATGSASSGNVLNWEDPFVRSYGMAPAPSNSFGQPQRWFPAWEDETNDFASSIGDFGLTLGSALSRQTGVPIAIMLGAHGGMPIYFFLRNDSDPASLATNYGKLLSRMRNAGLTESVRGILYYQGENDFGNTIGHHFGMTALRDDWREDYPNTERTWFCQIHTGCGTNYGSVNDLSLRDMQRRLEDEFPDARVLSTSGLSGHDRCHFAAEGYEALGLAAARQIRHDLYGAIDSGFAAPNVASVQMTSTAPQILRVLLRDETQLLEPIDNWNTLFRGSPAPNALSVDSIEFLPGEFTLKLAAADPLRREIGFIGSETGQPLIALRTPEQQGLMCFKQTISNPAADFQVSLSDNRPLTSQNIAVLMSSAEPAALFELLADNVTVATSENASAFADHWLPQRPGRHTLTARMTDHLGLSKEIKQLISVGTPSPPKLSRLQLWLSSANGTTLDERGKLVSWNDVRKNGMALSQPIPALRPQWFLRETGPAAAVRFTGEKHLDCPALPVSTDWTLILALTPGNRFGPAPLLTSVDGATVLLEQQEGGSLGVFGQNAGNLSVQRPHVLAICRDAASGQMAVEIDGLRSTPFPAPTANFPSGFRLGGGASSVQGWQGEITDFLLYDCCLAAAETSLAQESIRLARLSPLPYFLATLPAVGNTPDADPDKDGRSNFMEYALGSDPLTIDGDALEIRPGPAPKRPILEYVRPHDTSGVGFYLEWTEDGAYWDWFPDDLYEVTAAPIPERRGYDLVRCTLTQDFPFDHFFLRLAASTY